MVAILEYFSGLQLRALQPYVPEIPDWWWKSCVKRRTLTTREAVTRRVLFQEARRWQQEEYYAVRGTTVYRHRTCRREGEETIRENYAYELPDQVLALRDSGGGACYPVALLVNGDQYSLGFAGKREMIPLRKPYLLREFELH
jgi:hypothetical protein